MSAPADQLRALGDRIVAAVREVIPTGHAQSSVLTYGPRRSDSRIVAEIALRVGKWRASARTEDLAYSGAKGLAAILRTRMLARAAWHETMARAHRLAANVITEDARYTVISRPGAVLHVEEHALTDEERAALDCGGLFGKGGAR